MIKQKINLVVDWLLSMRKRLSETLKLWKTWCSQKVQHFHKLMKTSRINKIVRNFIETSEITKLVRKFVGIEKKPKKTIKKKATAKKKTTASKK